MVRPYSADRALEAWQPVLAELQRVPPVSNEAVKLPEAGDYVVFLEGPADDPLWTSANLERVWIQLLDTHTHQMLRARSDDVDYTYEAGRRHGRALTRVTAPRADWYELDVSGEDLEARDFLVTLHASGPVEERAWAASLWRMSGWGAVGLLGFAAVVLLMKEES